MQTGKETAYRQKTKESSSSRNKEYAKQQKQHTNKQAKEPIEAKEPKRKEKKTMAQRNFKESDKQYELHPEGTFKGYVCEVRPMGQQEYGNDEGGVTIADKVMILIRNLDGKATYTLTDDHGSQEVCNSAIGKFVNFYDYTPGPKSEVYKTYRTLLGHEPEFKNNFDDECILGVCVMYQVVHNIGQGKHEGKTFSNIATIMRDVNQTLSPDAKIIYQADKQAEEDAQYESAGLNGNQQKSSAQRPATKPGATNGTSPAAKPNMPKPPSMPSPAPPQAITTNMREYFGALVDACAANGLCGNGPEWMAWGNDTDSLLEFREQTVVFEKALKGAGIALPEAVGVHPDSTGGDPLPF